jgi:hypothetical protein
MAGVREFQQKLLTDPDARRAFAENPRKVLEELGVSLPEGTELPDSIPLDELERNVQQINVALQEQQTDLDRIDFSSTAAVTHFVEDAVPLRTRDLRFMERVHDEFATEALVGGRRPGDAATIAVVGAVVAAVVAVPVAVFGVTDKIRDRIQPGMGIERLSSRAGGLVVHGPQGLRVEGASVDQVADLITRLRPGP